MRFNIGILPKFLTDEHLFAESRELKFLPAYYGKYGDKGRGRIPDKFTLGTLDTFYSLRTSRRTPS